MTVSPTARQQIAVWCRGSRGWPDRGGVPRDADLARDINIAHAAVVATLRFVPELVTAPVPLPPSAAFTLAPREADSHRRDCH